MVAVNHDAVVRGGPAPRRRSKRIASVSAKHHVAESIQQQNDDVASPLSTPIEVTMLHPPLHNSFFCLTSVALVKSPKGINFATNSSFFFLTFTTPCGHRQQPQHQAGDFGHSGFASTQHWF